jgi:hypothetical protein
MVVARFAWLQGVHFGLVACCQRRARQSISIFRYSQLEKHTPGMQDCISGISMVIMRDT